MGGASLLAGRAPFRIVCIVVDTEPKRQKRNPGKGNQGLLWRPEAISIISHCLFFKNVVFGDIVTSESTSV